VLQPVQEAAKLAHQHGAILHCDAAQAVGRIAVHFAELEADALTVAAHKLHGPVGVGALVTRSDVALAPQLWGGFQQQGSRPGSESVALVAGMVEALASRRDDSQQELRMAALRDRLEATLLAGDSQAIVVGAGSPRLPQTTNIAFVGLDRQALAMALDLAGVAASTGSACASGSSEPSATLIAMNVEEAVVRSSLRFSLGAFTTAADVEQAAERILLCVNNLR
jgi:cysteine desulfurase